MKKDLLTITACFAACLLLAGCVESHAETGADAAETTMTAETAETAAETPASGSAAPVYFTSDITAEGLVKIYDTLGWTPSGKTAVKISTGEPPASNYLRPELIGDLVKKVDGTIVE